MGWYSKGFDAAEEQVAANAKTFTRDFFFKSGETVKFRFLQDDSFNIRAHFVKGKGWFTCIQGIGEEDCPLCEAGNRPQNQFVFNVLDPREYTDTKGNTYKDQVKLWRVGITLLRMLDKKRSKYGPYTELEFEISKMGQGQSTSYDIEVEKVKPVKLTDEQELYDLEEVLRPKTRSELLAIINGVKEEDPDVDDDDDDADDEDIDWRKS